MKGENIDMQKQTLKARGICVVIPTYNNAGSIEQVVRQTLLYCDDVIVVCDGCTDRTLEIIHTIEGITVVEYSANKGKGYALKQGFRTALEQGFFYAITLDADGQHYPQDISCFLKANQEHPGCLIVGKRNLAGVDRSSGSSFANKFSNFWFHIQTGCKLEDTQTGYRLYPLKKLYGLSLLTSRYEAELELLVFASWHGVKLVSIPVEVFYPPREKRVSHFRPATDFVRISFLNTFLCGLAIIYGLPLRLFRGGMRFLRTGYSLFFVLFFSLCIFTPLVWIYLKIGNATEAKCKKLHKLIYHAARFVMLKHGIPGAAFSYHTSRDTTFDRPAVIICNHQSHLDLMCQLIFTPKIIFLTNDWVWNNPIYGVIIRNAEYYPIANGIENLLPQLKSLVERGYSIAVYPEGTRSKDCKIGRFHQGAFYIAQQLKLDIQPMYLYGPGKILPKKTYSLRKGKIHIEVESRFSQEQLCKRGNVRQQASYMHKYYIKKYAEMCNQIEKDA